MDDIFDIFLLGKDEIRCFRLASSFYDDGVSIQTIRDYLGHNNENMTKQYIDYMPKRIEQANMEYFNQTENLLATGIIPKKRGEKTGK